MTLEISSKPVEITYPYLPKCFSCGETCNVPKILPCLHTACLPCLKTDRVKLSVPCPLCDTKSVLPHSVPGLTDNAFVANVLNCVHKEPTASHNSLAEDIPCTSCDNDLPAKKYCVICTKYLCFNCVAAHAHMTVFKDHMVMELGEFLMYRSSKERGVYCRIHQTKLLDIYCGECDEAFCVACQESAHGFSGHDTVPLSTATPRLPAVVCDMIKKLKVLTNQTLPSTIREFSLAKVELEKRLENARLEVQEMTECNVNLIKEYEEEMLCELESICAKKIEHLETGEKQLQENSHLLQCTCKVAEDILKYANKAELLAMKDTLLARLTHVTSEKFLTPKCNLKDETTVFFRASITPLDLNQLRENLGSIQQSLAFPPNVRADGNGLYSGRVGQRETVVIDARCEYVEGLISNFTVRLENRLKREEPVELYDDPDKQGTYKLVFCPQMLGRYKLEIKLFGKHIRGSPFCMQVRRKPSYSDGSDGDGGRLRRETCLLPKAANKGHKEVAQKRRVDKACLLKIKDWIQSDQSTCTSSSGSLGQKRHSSVGTLSDVFKEAKPELSDDPAGNCDSVSFTSNEAPPDANINKSNSNTVVASHQDLKIMNAEHWESDRSIVSGFVEQQNGSTGTEMTDHLVTTSQHNELMRSAENWESDSINSVGGFDRDQHGTGGMKNHDLNENFLEWNGSLPSKETLKGNDEGTCSRVEHTSEDDAKVRRWTDQDLSHVEEGHKEMQADVAGGKYSPTADREESGSFGDAEWTNSYPLSPENITEVWQTESETGSIDMCPKSPALTLSPFSSSSGNLVVKKSPNSGPLRKPLAARQLGYKDTRGDDHCGSDPVTKELESAEVPSVDLENLLASTCSVFAPLVRKFGSFGVDHGHLRYPIGIAITPGGNYVIANTGNNRVEVFDPDGGFKWCIGDLGQFSRPSAVVVTQSGDILVKDDIEVQVFNSDGKFLTSFGRSLFKSPYGMAVDKHGHVIVLDTCKHKYNARVVMFDVDGSVIHCKTFEPLANGTHHKCRFIDVYEDNLIVSDLGNHAVYVTTLQGELRTKFGSKGTTVGKFNEPSGVTVDSVGNILIADSKNDRIQVFRLNGEFIGHITCQGGLMRPSDILLTKDGHLFVVNFLQHCVKKFKLPSLQ